MDATLHVPVLLIALVIGVTWLGLCHQLILKPLTLMVTSFLFRKCRYGYEYGSGYPCFLLLAS